jgi:leucyl aminopeptidase
MVHVCVTPKDLIDPTTKHIDTLCLIGTRSQFDKYDQWIANEVLPFSIDATGTDEPATKKPKLDETATTNASALIKSLLKTLQPSADNAASTELYVAREQREDSLLRIVVVLLPTKVSRHNCTGQSYNISSSLKKYITHTSKESIGVVILWDRPDQIFASVCAVSRIGGGLLYNRKTGGDDDTVLRHPKHQHTHSKSPLILGGISISETTIPDLNHVRVLFPTTVRQDELSNLALGVQLTRRLVDAPCNDLNSETFEEQAKEVIHGLHHVTSKVIKGEKLHQLGYGGLYNVGKAGM